MLIVDDAQKDVDKKIVMEFTFMQPVMSVRLRMDRYCTDQYWQLSHCYSNPYFIETTHVCVGAHVNTVVC